MLPLSVASMTISSLTLNSCIGKQTKHILCQNTQLFLLCSTNFNNSEQLKRSWNVYIHSNPCSPYCTEFLASLQHFAVHAPPDTPKPDERETSFRNIIDFSLSQNTKGNIDDFWKANNSTQPKNLSHSMCKLSMMTYSTCTQGKWEEQYVPFPLLEWHVEQTIPNHVLQTCRSTLSFSPFSETNWYMSICIKEWKDVHKSSWCTP
jgi:hypothetical protein